MADAEETPMAIDEALVGDVEAQVDSSGDFPSIIAFKFKYLFFLRLNSNIHYIKFAVPAETTVNESEISVVTTEAEAAVSKDFTAVDDNGNEVHYVTMTQEEAEAAGVEDDEQVCSMMFINYFMFLSSYLL